MMLRAFKNAFIASVASTAALTASAEVLEKGYVKENGYYHHYVITENGVEYTSKELDLSPLFTDSELYNSVEKEVLDQLIIAELEGITLDDIANNKQKVLAFKHLCDTSAKDLITGSLSTASIEFDAFCNMPITAEEKLEASKSLTLHVVKVSADEKKTIDLGHVDLLGKTAKLEMVNQPVESRENNALHVYGGKHVPALWSATVDFLNSNSDSYMININHKNLEIVGGGDESKSYSERLYLVKENNKSESTNARLSINDDIYLTSTTGDQYIITLKNK